MFLGNMALVNTIFSAGGFFHFLIHINGVLNLYKVKNMKTNFEKAEARIRCFSNQLKILYLNNLSLSSEELLQLMPSIMQCCPFLEELDLSGNNLTEFVFNNVLLDLKKLDLSGNNLTIFEVTESLHKLEELDLSENNFSRVPYTLIDLESVIYLDINNNKLKNLHGIENNCHLKILKVNGNENLTQYNGFGALRDLERLDVGKNPMTLRTLLDLSEVRIDRIGGLTEEHQRLVNQMKENSAEVSIVERILHEHAKISIREFSVLRQSLNENQVVGIVQFKLPLSELGIGIDSEGNFSTNLHFKETLPERFKKADVMKDFNQMESDGDTNLNRNPDGDDLKKRLKVLYSSGKEAGPETNVAPAISQPESDSDTSLDRKYGGKNFEQMKIMFSAKKQVSTENNVAPVISQRKSDGDANAKLPNTYSDVAHTVAMAKTQSTKKAENKKRNGSYSDTLDKKPAAKEKNLPFKKRKIKPASKKRIYLLKREK